MSEHVLDWIGAYLDGELEGDRRRGVEAHLRACADCRAEAEALRSLTARLQAYPPPPARTPPEQFVAQVRLRLPPRGASAQGAMRLRQATGLWLPLGVLAGWALSQAALLVGAAALRLAAALSLAPLPGGMPLVLPPVQGLGGPSALGALLAALAPRGEWGSWLPLWTLDIGVTIVATGLVWGCLAGHWAARRTGPGTNITSPGEPAG
jgi:hypothetical protein